jgi:hypothetical protein
MREKYSLEKECIDAKNKSKILFLKKKKNYQNIFSQIFI